MDSTEAPKKKSKSTKSVSSGSTKPKKVHIDLGARFKELVALDPRFEDIQKSIEGHTAMLATLQSEHKELMTRAELLGNMIDKLTPNDKTLLETLDVIAEKLIANKKQRATEFASICD